MKRTFHRPRHHFQWAGRLLALCSVVTLSGCGSTDPGVGPPAPVSQGINIEGRVVLGSAVKGALVTAYRLDKMTGMRLEAVATAMATDDRGAFSLALPAGTTGPFVFVAAGSGATYTELVTGKVVTLAPGASLVSAYRQPEGLGKPPLVVIGPWSDFAFAHAQALRRRGQAPDIAAALESSHGLFKEHLEYDFAATDPGVEPSQATDAERHATLLLFGLSSFVARAQASSAASRDTWALVQSLRVDLEDGRLDGLDSGNRPIVFGDCIDICRLSGRTLRTDFANAIARYLNTPTSAAGNTDFGGLAIKPLLSRLATRQNDLFSKDEAVADYDRVPPTIRVIETHVRDENSLGWQLQADPTQGIGELPVIVAASEQTLPMVSLAETELKNAPVFVKIITRYVLGDTAFSEGNPLNLPIWELEVEDSEPGPLAIRARILRGDAEIKPWFEVINDEKSGIRVKGNRVQIALSRALSDAIGRLDGSYRLEIEARDGVLNAQTKIVYWKQFVKPPPLRVIPALCNPCTDRSCPNYYTLGEQWPEAAYCGERQANALALLARSSDTAPSDPGGQAGPMVAAIRIDNPNPIAVRVRLHQGKTTQSNRATLVPKSCPTGPGYLAQMCMQASSDATKNQLIEYENEPVAISAVEYTYFVKGWQPVASACADCLSDELRIPANAWAYVSMHAGPWTFLAGDAKPRPFSTTAPGFIGITNATGTEAHAVLATYSVRIDSTTEVVTRNDDATLPFYPAVGAPHTDSNHLSLNRESYFHATFQWIWNGSFARSYFAHCSTPGNCTAPWTSR